MIATLVITALGAYLLGSMPFGLLLTRAAGLGDIRAIGSGNIGATNVLRTGRKGLAAATLLLDGGKGAAAVLIARSWGDEAALVAAAAVLMGHIFPIWLGFRGGKGVATALGLWFGLSWPVAVIACATWLIMAALFRFSSLAALVALATAPAWALWFADPWRAGLGLGVAALVAARHHANITRLLSGKEPKIGR